MSYESEARVINGDIFDLVNTCFEKERSTKDEQYRKNFFKNNKDYFVKTKDGSYSIKSKEINHKVEILHTSTGAISEAFEKFIKPLKLDYSRDINILDICGGIGYNSSAAIANFLKNSNNSNLNIDMVEISKATLACGLFVPSPILEHDITKKAIEEELINTDYAALNLENTKIPDNVKLKIYIEDARKRVQKLKDNTYDAIFLDPFSQTMAPELFTLDLFKEFRRIIKDKGVITTYTSSAPVRAAFIKAGFHVAMGPIFGRKQGGTLASPNIDSLDYSLPKNDEIRIALSDVALPFRDPNLDLDSKTILDNRAAKRKEARHNTKISSAVKSPIFLSKKMDEGRLKRRVERNLVKMNIPSTTSKEAFYIVSCEDNYQKAQSRENNSKNRILDMARKLDEVKSNQFNQF